ncbi:MAG: HD domain-containing phosphohydrolase, partial [Candidatus Eremiobacterota bacterium]
LRRRYLQLVATLVATFQGQDPFFEEHSRRVAALAVELGQELGLGGRQLDVLEVAGLLHDIGLAYVDREILSKAGQLTVEEVTRLREHPLLARNLLDQVPDMADIAPILSHHHERWDGSGYPHGLKGEEIPMESRLLAVAEAYDSLTHSRPHRPALDRERALAELARGAGAQFDPAVVHALQRVAGETRSLSDPSQILGRQRELKAVSQRLSAVLGLAVLFRESGDLEAAGQACEEAARLPGVASDPELAGWLTAERALLAARAGQPEAARAMGARVVELLPRVPPPGQARVLELLGRLYGELGHLAEARRALRQALSLAGSPSERLQCLTRLLLLPGEVDQGLMRRWEAEAPPGYRDNLPLAERKVLAARLPRAAPEPAPSSDMRAMVLGPLQVACGERVTPTAAWTTRKAQELFAFLLIQNRPVPSESLMETLWPDSEGARQTLHTTASRVRRALRSVTEKPVLRAERNFYMLDGSFTCDLWHFDRACEQALGNRGPLSQAEEEACHRAVGLYRGDFLEGLWEPWTEPIRVGARERRVAVLARLAGHHEGRGDFPRACECYARMLEGDTCREEAHLGLMRCAYRQGQRDAALKRYQEYCRLLQQELGLEPSPEAAALHREILAAR